MSKLGEDAVRSENPFKPKSRRGNEDTLKYCAWEVLKDFPRGLHISQIAKEVQGRGLRDLSRMRNATGQISSELVRAKGVFCQTHVKKTWRIRALSPSVREPQRQAPPSAERPLAKGQELVGHRVSVWWKGEDAYFDGVIRRFAPATGTYDVVYDDGDTDDDLKFHKYDIQYKDNRIDVITVAEHNRDDSEESGSDDDSKGDVSEWTASEGSLDSTFCEDEAESLPRSRKRPAEGKKASNKQPSGGNKTGAQTTFLDASNRTILPLTIGLNQNPGSGWMAGMALNDACADRKRRTHPRDDDKTLKKTRVEEGIHALRMGQPSALVPGLRSGLMRTTEGNLGWTGRQHPLALNQLLAHNWHTHPATVMIAGPPGAGRVNPTGEKNEAKSDDRLNNNAIGSRSAIGATKTVTGSTEPTISSLQLPTRKVEKIDVLHLKRQLQPPESKRPNLKNLTDVGELMSMKELSEELAHLEDGASEEEEVTSRCAVAAGDEDGIEYSQMQNSLPKEAHSSTSMGLDLGPELGSRPMIGKTEPVVSLSVNPLWKTRHSVSPIQLPNPTLQFVSSEQHPLQSHLCIPRNAGFSFGGYDLLSPSILSKQPPVNRTDKSPASNSFVAVSQSCGNSGTSGEQKHVEDMKPVAVGAKPGEGRKEAACQMLAGGREDSVSKPSVDVKKLAPEHCSLTDEPTSQPLLFESFKRQSASAAEDAVDPPVDGHWKDGVSIAHA